MFLLICQYYFSQAHLHKILEGEVSGQLPIESNFY